MPKRIPPLDDRKIKSAITAFTEGQKRTDRLSDGDVRGLNLFLERFPSGEVSASWKVRRRADGKEIDRYLSVPPYPKTGLKKARNIARAYLDKLRAGIDPAEEKRKEREEKERLEEQRQRDAYTFGKAAAKWMETSREADLWKNNVAGERKADSYLRRCILPVIGDVPVNELNWRHVFDVMMFQDIYKDHNEDAKKCRAIINQVCIAAHTDGNRDSEDGPARLVGPLKAKLDLVVPHKKEKAHQPRVEPDDVPEFFAQLREVEGLSARMLEFTILTAARPGMVHKSTHKDPITGKEFIASARWKDIDLDAGVWEVSPIIMKMKGRDPFVVYLSSYAVSLLKSLPRIEGSPWVFSPDGRRPLSAGAMTSVIKRMNQARAAAGLNEWIDDKESRKAGQPVRVTPHGTARSSFRTWLTTDKHKNYQRFNHEAAELCLAHFVGDDYGGGYNRPDLADARRECMEAWGRYCVTGLYPDE